MWKQMRGATRGKQIQNNTNDFANGRLQQHL